MKKFYLVMAFICIFMFKTYAFAQNDVYITIESYDKTISSGYTSGETLVQCLDHFANLKKIPIVYGNENGYNKIYSIKGIEENLFGDTDGWFTYIIRDDEVIQNIDMLDYKIYPGDTIVVYYGDFYNTKIINRIDESIENNTLSLQLDINRGIDESVGGIRVHLYTPKNTQRIIKTDENGVVKSNLTDLGMYSYYAENYSYDSYPYVVKTPKEEVFFGPADKDATTRGEAIDFIVNNFSIKRGDSSSINFDDTSINDFYFQELNIATTNNLISGYEDNTFRGDNPITLLEFACILSRISDNDDYEILDLDVPSWAVQGVSKAVAEGYVSADDNFYRYVTEDDLLKIANK